MDCSVEASCHVSVGLAGCARATVWRRTVTFEADGIAPAAVDFSIEGPSEQHCWNGLHAMPAVPNVIASSRSASSWARSRYQNLSRGHSPGCNAARVPVVLGVAISSSRQIAMDERGVTYRAKGHSRYPRRPPELPH